MDSTEIKVSQILADHFATIADVELTDIKDFIDHPSVQLIVKNEENSPEAFVFELVNETEVRTVLESLDVKNATGGDGTPTRVLKISAKETALPLCTLFNSCIKKGTWPKDWKGVGVGVIGIQFLKKGDRQARKNYRPIRVLSCLNKAFERLLSYCLSQTPSLALWSTGNVPRTTSYLSVSSQRTCRKLLTLCIHHSCYASYGFRNKAVDMLLSYLYDRQSRVRIGTVGISWRPVNRGCPLGLVLGPLLCRQGF